MRVDDFEYDLPEELIAQEPAVKRTGSKMMVMKRRSGLRESRKFSDLPQYLGEGDCLVINDTRVIAARLFGEKVVTGGKVELLLLEELEDTVWSCLLRPAKRLDIGSKVAIIGSDNVCFELLEKGADGVCIVSFAIDNVADLIRRCGSVPLPPYIQRQPEDADTERYQTVFAATDGAVAAPTAGLHFDDAMLDALRSAGVVIVPTTLHVGLGTFKPMSVDCVENHEMHAERYILPADSAVSINRTRANGGRIVAVGTTTVRVLETCAARDGTVVPGHGKTNIFIYPPYVPKCVDCLLTNFHLPKSTLMMLVSTFVSREQLMQAYQAAIVERFRFYSYGDCMLLL